VAPEDRQENPYDYELAVRDARIAELKAIVQMRTRRSMPKRLLRPLWMSLPDGLRHWIYLRVMRLPRENPDG
jgi:hypothetical protein